MSVLQIRSPRPRKRRAPKGFSPKASQLEHLTREGYVTACKLFLGSLKSSRHAGFDAFEDGIAELLGWPVSYVTELGFRSPKLVKAVKARLKELSSPALPRDDRFERNVEFLGARLELSPVELAILRLAVLLEVQGVPSDIADHMHPRAPRERSNLLSQTLGFTRPQVERALGNEAALVRSGLVRPAGLVSRHVSLRERLDLIEGVAHQLTETDLLNNGMRSPHAAAMPAPRLMLAAYPHLDRDLALVQRILSAAIARRTAGINILLFGPPGTGKTELSRALIAAVGGAGYELKSDFVASADEDPGEQRLRKYALTQRLLSGGAREVMVFDEMEDSMASEDSLGVMAFGAEGGLHPRKAWKNSLLESNPVPAIWICNGIGRLDPALQRRFTYCLEVPVPPRSVRAGMLEALRHPIHVDASVLGKLADSDRLTPADIGRAGAVMELCPPQSASDWREQVLKTIGSRPRGVDTGSLGTASKLPELAYEPGWITATPSLEHIAGQMRATGEARLCFAGPPGTGKTAFARHLARELDRPLISKKASDLLSPYLGEMEQNLAHAFRESQRERAVLLLDEADSFLRDRRAASKSWEVTQVNELLKQLEEHAGYVILATNFLEMLDPAVLRRLDLKVTFGYLQDDQLPRVFERSADALGLASAETQSFAAGADWRGLQSLALGDVSAAMRQVRIGCREPRPGDLYQAMKDQLAFRSQLGGRRIGF